MFVLYPFTRLITAPLLILLLNIVQMVLQLHSSLHLQKRRRRPPRHTPATVRTFRRLADGVHCRLRPFPYIYLIVVVVHGAATCWFIIVTFSQQDPFGSRYRIVVKHTRRLQSCDYCEMCHQSIPDIWHGELFGMNLMDTLLVEFSSSHLQLLGHLSSSVAGVQVDYSCLFTSHGQLSQLSPVLLPSRHRHVALSATSGVHRV